MGTNNILQGFRRVALAALIGSGLLVFAHDAAAEPSSEAGTTGRSSAESAAVGDSSSCPMVTTVDDFVPGSRRMPRS